MLCVKWAGLSLSLGQNFRISSVKPCTHKMYAFILVASLASSGFAMRIILLDTSIDFRDTSNCTLSAWSVCSLETEGRCSRQRTLMVLPYENQTMVGPTIQACHGQGGHVESESCRDGLCPQWRIGEWSDCSGTCKSTLPPWQGYQRRSVECMDSAEVLYREAVCENLYGIALKPIDEQACECSHKVKPFDPYANTYQPVDV